MIQKIIVFSVKNKLIIGLLTLAMVAMGIWSATEVPIDAVPDITNNQVQVITQAPNLGTEDIEQFVTLPVELAMANLPGVIEIRSISRFGLSVTTVVFEDEVGTFLPRQLVGERLDQVRDDIPEGFGRPFMGPITTGLGEIYQYTLEVADEFRNEYDLAELRTIQDWIIRRQMAMVPGVIEVNAFGGLVKQYEVAVNPNELRAIGITTGDILKALELNNANTGSAYIEKDHVANFIRGEGLVKRIADIEQIVVKHINGLPITIKDIAEVRFGSGTRYGAFTKDGKGQAVGGIILMMKGENSNKVIKGVKARMEEIEKTLPEGITIEPFLDRSKLIDQTTGTVTRNLTEGALIVIFVLVFLLGNWRGGLIVASTIPLSLLFAFILMNAFNVWANLMSLGAIDFGIIVDGAVIIVESTVFVLYKRLGAGGVISKQVRDETASQASSKMMNAAFFGQLIILIVFIPILTLEGIEGKMFKPMALTFMFAMIGVMILCLTYVPMMSALFLRVGESKRNSWGDRLIRYLESVYAKSLKTVFGYGRWVLMVALVALVIAVFTFSRMGGEFIPKLDEGDIAFHDLLKPGSSLSEAIQVTTQVENIIIDNFPEVERVLSRIGVSDVPIDLMPMDAADCFIILKPEHEWVSAKTKEELIDKIKGKISEVPGVNYEFTQPIEMRFNELMTGVREDVAVKLFGEDLGVLEVKAQEIVELIQNIEGVGDIKAEPIAGLPQITIRYDRTKLAQYGVNIADVNQAVETAFAGMKAGVIFEGEKRFDLVVRFQDAFRKSIEDVKNVYVDLPEGAQIPLSKVAEVQYQTGPMQISRDNTNRRTYVGINVRGRDIKSLVEEIRQKLEANLDLPAGYYIRYGGAFENLERATARLRVVVPISLGLIFLLIYFALRSIRQTLMIYMAIPLAAIGGVFSLWIRDMPFSISAGIGFIVLFGIAVLNGLVLINGWNELKQEGMKDLDQRIIEGAKRRVRPILLTASTDILGFLPMAISTSAGAEVQRPLATVVIGGMVSATLLTLLVLPLLYRWIESYSVQRISSKMVAGLLLTMGLMVPSLLSAQQPQVINSADDAINLALVNNPDVKVAEANIEIAREGKKAAWNINQANLSFQYGQYDGFENDFAIQLNQTFSFPTLYSRKARLADAKAGEEQWRAEITKNELKKSVRLSWNQLEWLTSMRDLLQYQDSLFSGFVKAAQLRYETEASDLLELTNAETQAMEVQNQLQLVEADLKIVRQQLKLLINDTTNLDFVPTQLQALIVDEAQAIVTVNPELGLYRQGLQSSRIARSVATAELLPSLTIGYFNQSLIGSPRPEGGFTTASDRFEGVSFGLGLPLFFGANKAKIRAAGIRQSAAQTRLEYYEQQLESQQKRQLQEVDKLKKSVTYYESKALPQADLIIEGAQKSYQSGAIDYMEFIRNVNQALNIKSDFLNTLAAYNRAVIQLKFILGR